MKPGRNPVIKQLQDDQNLPGLISVLRYGRDPDLRAESAKAIAILTNYEGVESLIRSFTEDPDAEVQAESRQALYDLLGSESKQAIDAYLANPVSGDTWLTDEAASYFDDAPYPNRPKTNIRWEEKDIRGLTAVLSSERNLDIKLQAIEALKSTPGMHAIDALAYFALYGEENEIQQAATKALEEMYGKEEATSLLETYRVSGIVPYEDEDEDSDLEDQEDAEQGNFEDEELEDEVEEDQSATQNIPSPSSGQFDPQNPVLQEEKTRFIAYIMAFLIIVFIIGAGYYLLTR